MREREFLSLFMSCHESDPLFQFLTIFLVVLVDHFLFYKKSIIKQNQTSFSIDNLILILDLTQKVKGSKFGLLS